MGVADINPGRVTVGKDGNIADIAFSLFVARFIDFHFIVFVDVVGGYCLWRASLTVFYTGLFVSGQVRTIGKGNVAAILLDSEGLVKDVVRDFL